MYSPCIGNINWKLLKFLFFSKSFLIFVKGLSHGIGKWTDAVTSLVGRCTMFWLFSSWFTSTILNNYWFYTADLNTIDVISINQKNQQSSLIIYIIFQDDAFTLAHGSIYQRKMSVIAALSLLLLVVYTASSGMSLSYIILFSGHTSLLVFIICKSSLEAPSVCILCSNLRHNCPHAGSSWNLCD